MRVLQIHNAYGLPGGEDTIVDTEAKLLEADGHVVYRFGVTNPTAGTAAVRELMRSPRNKRAADMLSERIRSWRPDIAHVHNTWFSLSPEIFHRLAAESIPVVMTLQNYRLICANAQLFRGGEICTECVGSHPWRGVAHRCYRGSAPASLAAAATIDFARRRHSFDHVVRFIAPSRFVKDVFVGAGFEARRIVVRPNVVDDPGARLGPPSDSKTVLYAGRLSPEKGLPTLLDGWQRSGLGDRGFTLKLVGEGPLRHQLERDAPTSVRFFGWLPVNQLRADMLSLRALVFPSEWYENFGRVIIEAMAAGLPVLASDIASPAEIVGAIGPSWLVPPGDALAWGRALAKLADDPIVDDAGSRARQLYENRYSLRNGLESLLSIYREVALACSS